MQQDAKSVPTTDPVAEGALAARRRVTMSHRYVNY